MASPRKKRVLQLSVFILALVVTMGLLLRTHHTAQTYGQCVTACLAERQCDLDFRILHEIGANCLIYQNQCFARCGGGAASSGPVAYETNRQAALGSRGTYGAIAYDKGSGAWGLADASPNQESANQSALGFCSKYGPHCFIVASFSNVCAAVATGGKNIVAWAKDPNRDVAQKTAGSNCAKKTKTSCTLRLSNCYLP